MDPSHKTRYHIKILMIFIFASLLGKIFKWLVFGVINWYYNLAIKGNTKTKVVACNLLYRNHVDRKKQKETNNYRQFVVIPVLVFLFALIITSHKVATAFLCESNVDTCAFSFFIYFCLCYTLAFSSCKLCRCVSLHNTLDNFIWLRNIAPRLGASR